LSAACKTDVHTIHAFLNATEGNWRNSLYIDCSRCHFGGCDCDGFLFAPTEDGTPLLLPVCDARILFSHSIDFSECLGSIPNAYFCELFRLWLRPYRHDNTQCPLRSMIVYRAHPKWET
jgi:hypothetical protein